MEPWSQDSRRAWNAGTYINVSAYAGKRHRQAVIPIRPPVGTIWPPRMSTIVCRGLSFGYDGSENNVLTGLDLVIDTGRRSVLSTA